MQNAAYRLKKLKRWLAMDVEGMVMSMDSYNLTPSAEGLNWIHKWLRDLIKILPATIKCPSIFPTYEGELEAEWSNDSGWSFSLTINPETGWAVIDNCDEENYANLLCANSMNFIKNLIVD